MRLLIATPLYPPEPGGPATYAQLIERGLPEHAVKTQVVKFSDVRTRPKLIRHLSYYARILRAGKNADAILALDPVSVGLPACMAARVLNKPFYVKIVGDYAWEQGVQRFGVQDSLDEFVLRKRVPLMVSVLRFVQRYVARNAKKVIVPSNYLKHIVSTWKIPESKIHVIYNAMSLEDGGAVPEQVGVIKGPRIVSIGRLVPWKGMKELITAAGALETPATLVIVGDGPDRKMLEAHAQDVLGERCLFTGPLNHADTIATLKTADIFVLNSTYEGLSHVLIEALMVGVPIVATRCGGNAELITDQKDGLLVDVGDTDSLSRALSTVLHDPELMATLATNARIRSSDFEVAGMLEKTASFFKTA